MGYGVGVWTIPSWIDFVMLVTLHYHRSYPLDLDQGGFFIGLYLRCFAFFLALAECWDCLIFTGYPLLFLFSPCVGSQSVGLVNRVFYRDSG